MRAALVAFWLALAVWLGEVVFFSFVVAPNVFRVLPRESAGQVVAAMFPTYYAIGTIAGMVALAAAVTIWRALRASAAWLAVTIMLALMLVATAYAGGVLHPEAQGLRAALHREPVDPIVQARFDAVHRRAVALNGGVLLLGIATVCVAASRLEP